MYFNIKHSSSKNNMYIYEDLCIDAGNNTTIKDLEEECINAVYYTHWHSDHYSIKTHKWFMKRNIPVYMHIKSKRLRAYPRLNELKKKHPELIDNIIWIDGDFEIKTELSTFKIVVHEQKPHNVPVFPLSITIDSELTGVTTLFHATDIGNLSGIEAKNLNYYFIESNYTNYKIDAIRKDLAEKGKFDRFARSVKEHLSDASCERFYKANKGPDTVKLYKLHKSEQAWALRPDFVFGGEDEFNI